MSLSLKSRALSTSTSTVACRRSMRVRPVAPLRAADNKGPTDADGYISKDNSGNGNIYPTSARPFVSSPTSEAIANSGLGGNQGGAFVAGAIVVVALITATIGGQSGETLQTLDAAFSGDSLSAIAARIAATL